MGAPRYRSTLTTRNVAQYYLPMGWTIFAAVDLYIGVILIDLISKSAPPEKLPRLRKARNVTLVLLGISILVLGIQVAREWEWI